MASNAHRLAAASFHTDEQREVHMPRSRSLLDAAQEVLEEEGKPLHYKDLTDRVVDSGRWCTSGKTPERTLSALLGIDIRQREASGERSRFERAGRGLVRLSPGLPIGVAAEVDKHNQKVRDELLKAVQEKAPEQFESLVATLLKVMGLQNVEPTQLTRDKGVDVRGILVVAGAISVRFAVQVKRWKNNVQAPEVRKLRGSLKEDEYGLFVTTSDFTRGAEKEATSDGKRPIALINGDKLIELLIQNAESLKEAAEAVEGDDLGGVVVERERVLLLNLPQSTTADVDVP